jgi:hypothetical protein
MSLFGPNHTWKIVYVPKADKCLCGANGVALVEAVDQSEATWIFQKQYAGQFHTIESCKKLLG